VETAKLLTIIQRSYPNHFKEFDPDTFRIQERMWSNAFYDYTYQECFTAFEIWFNTEIFPPVPANLKPILQKYISPNQEMTAEQAWEIVDRAVRKFGSYNQDKAFATFSDSIQRSVRSVGGWQKICATPLGREWDFLRKNFMESYKDFGQDKREQASLPSPVLKRLQEAVERKKLGQPK
jgi:hypothetical protein